MLCLIQKTWSKQELKPSSCSVIDELIEMFYFLIFYWKVELLSANSLRTQKLFKESSDWVLVKRYNHLDEGQGLFFSTEMSVHMPLPPIQTTTFSIYFPDIFLFCVSLEPSQTSSKALVKSNVSVLCSWIAVAGELYKSPVIKKWR